MAYEHTPTVLEPVLASQQAILIVEELTPRGKHASSDHAELFGSPAAKLGLRRRTTAAKSAGHSKTAVIVGLHPKLLCKAQSPNLPFLLPSSASSTFQSL